MKRKILSLILAFAMTVSLLTVGTGAVEPTYGDTAGHWAESSIERWSAYGIIQGSNGQFDPNGQLTCAQLATILAKLLKLPAAKDAGFTDNTADAWYYDAINRCAAAGILNGNGDGTVTPEAPITRERAMVMLARALGIEPIRKPDLTKYTDAAQVSAYAQGYVAALIEAGIVGGVTADELAPQDNINRASTVTILDRAIGTYADEAGATVKADGKGIVLVVAENVKITGAPEGTKIVVADGATGLTVNGKSVSDDQTYIVPKATTGSGSSGGYSHTHSYDPTTHKCSCGEVDPAYAVASVSGKNYLTLSEAITAAQSGNKPVTLAASKTTTETIQEILDGQHGSIDGLIIELPSGTYGKLELGRATAYAGSNTTYACPHNEPTIAGGGSASFTNVKDYIAHMTGYPHHGDARTFTRTMSNLTITAQKGATVTVNGLTLLARTYGDAKDPFVTSTEKDYIGYNIDLVVHDLAFSNINFTGKVEIASENRDNTTIDDVTFENCKFETNDTATTNGQAINFSNNVNNGQVKNLIVKNCDFTSCYQGVYTNQVRNVSVTGCTFDNTGHNAIAVQSASNSSCNHGAVVITGNTFTDIHNRIIRFNKVGADTQITITYNTADNNSGKKVENTETREVIAAVSLAEGVTRNIHHNSWGDGATFGTGFTEETGEPCAEINGVKYISLAKALAAAKNGDTVKLVGDAALDADVSISNQITLNLDGKTIETNGKKINVTATGNLTVTGSGIVNNNTEATVETVNGNKVGVRYTMFAVDAGGELDIENGTFKTKASQIVYTEGTTIIAGGTFENTAGDVNEGLGSSSMLCAKGASAVLTMNGGSIVATAESQDNGIYGIYGANGAQITLNDSVSVHTSLAAIGMNNTTSNPEVVVTINGGEYKTTNTKLGTSYPQFNTVVYLPGKCHVTINGGTFTAEDTNTHIFSVPYVKVGVNLSISNGTFDGKTDVFFTGTQALSGQNEANTIAITGGTFSSDPSAYVAEGYTAIPAGENVWNVVEGNWVTPATVATKEYKESNMTYHFAAGTYSGTTTLEVGANTNTVFEAADGAEFENLTIKYNVDRYGETDKSSSSMTVKGFKVTGTLDINCADGTLVVEGNIAKTAKITMNRQDGKENASILIKDNKFDGGKYGIQLIPNHSHYTLTISGNTFSNHSSHAISVMGYQSDLTASDATRTEANTITVSGNTFNSYGSSKAAFKIWGDTKYAPNGTDPLNDAAKALAASVQANNTFATTLDSSCVLADFYGKTVSFSPTSPM